MDRQAADTQRILWAVVAVSLLVIIVLAGGLYFLRPRGAEATEVATADSEAPTFDPFEYVRSDQETPGLEETADSPRQVTLVVGDVQAPASTESPAGREAPALPAPAIPSAATPAAVNPVAVKPTAASVSNAPVPAPAPAPAPRAVSDFQYWIQVGSFSSRSRADDLHKLLVDLGYAGSITAHDADGVTMHRVRIGPIASRPEADLVLGKLRTANDMDGWIAQVRG